MSSRALVQVDKTRAGRWCQARPTRSARSLRLDTALAIDTLAVALHLELLQVGRQPLQPLLVRQTPRVSQRPARSVPDAEEAQYDGRVPFERRGAEVLIHFVRAIEQLLEVM